MNANETKSIFRLVIAGWPTQRQKLSDEDITQMAMLYTAGLADLDYEAARAAVVRIARTAKWMPTIADICEAVMVVQTGHRRTGAEAWGDVLKAIRKYGWVRSPGLDFRFDDPIVARVVNALGWQDLCHSEGAMIAADRARFIESYEQIRDQERADRAATPGLAVAALPAPAPRAELAPPAPILSAEERSKSLRAVLEQAVHDNPHLAPELQSLADTVGDLEEADAKARELAQSRPPFCANHMAVVKYDELRDQHVCAACGWPSTYKPPAKSRVTTIGKALDEVLPTCQSHGARRDEDDICMACGERADGPPGIIGRSH